MMKALCTWIFKSWMGWTIQGEWPHHVKRKMVIVAPHTSNWDFVVGLLVKYQLGLKVSYVGKKSLFRWPMGWLFRYWGGIPVDRSPGNDAVSELGRYLIDKEEITFCLAPEGSRKKVDRLKSGFYRIAQIAHLPILMVKLDYGNKEVIIDELFEITKSLEETIEYVSQYYRGTIGKVKDNSFV